MIVNGINNNPNPTRRLEDANKDNKPKVGQQSSVAAPKPSRDSIQLSARFAAASPVTEKSVWDVAGGFLSSGWNVVVQTGSAVLDKVSDLYDSLSETVMNSFAVLTDSDKNEVKNAAKEAKTVLENKGTTEQQKKDVVNRTTDTLKQKNIITAEQAESIRGMSTADQLRALEVMLKGFKAAGSAKEALAMSTKMNKALGEVSEATKKSKGFINVTIEYADATSTVTVRITSRAAKVVAATTITAPQYAEESENVATAASIRVNNEAALKGTGVAIPEPVVNKLAAAAVHEVSTAKLMVKVGQEKGFEINTEVASIASGKYLAAGAISGKTALAMVSTDTGAIVTLSSKQLLILSTMIGEITETVVSMLASNRAANNILDQKVQEANIEKNLGEKKADEKRQDKIEAEIKSLTQKLDNAKSVEERKFIKSHIDELKQKLG